MSRLTRDETVEPVSRDQILRHARGQGNIIFPVQPTTSRIGNLTRLIHTLLYVMTIHTYIQGTRTRTSAVLVPCTYLLLQASLVLVDHLIVLLPSPGNGVQSNGRRVRGTPATAGRYKVQVLRLLRWYSLEPRALFSTDTRGNVRGRPLLILLENDIRKGLF